MLKEFGRGQLDREDPLRKLEQRNRLSKETASTYAYKIIELAKVAYFPTTGETIKDYFGRGLNTKVQFVKDYFGRGLNTKVQFVKDYFGRGLNTKVQFVKDYFVRGLNTKVQFVNYFGLFW